VAIVLPNLPHYPAIYFGILKAGAICVTCNPVFTADELKYQIVDAGVRVVFCMDHPVLYRTAVQAVEGTGVETTFICNLGLLPWYHSFGQTVIMLGACYSGNKLVCIPDPRAGNPPFTKVLKAVQKYRATILPAVPTIMVAFNHHSKLHQYDLSSLKACLCGGAPLSPEVCRQFEDNTGAIVFEGWGLTETAPVANANPTDTAHRKIGSVGLPMPSTDIKIVDYETGFTELPQGKDGEMAISGPQVMQGYWNRAEENKAAFREINGRQFFLSGDIGHMDKDGFFFITERKKDMIIVGGFNVYPKEVEEVLYTHPKVQLAAVVGLPDPKSGESIKAFVQLKPGQVATEKEILDFCRERMAGYKRPRRVEFRNPIPTSLVGKVLRRVLREEELRRMADSGESEK
jgi:long-chain acyl-CoA synthetase